MAKRRVLGRLSSCSGEGGSQMGGGENTQEHRKVEAVGVGWESMPCPHLRAFDQTPGWGRGGTSPDREGWESHRRETGPPGRAGLSIEDACVPKNQTSWAC